LLSQGNKQSALKGIVTSEDGAALRATLVSNAAFLPFSKRMFKSKAVPFSV
jgi:hypothetical protein